MNISIDYADIKDTLNILNTISMRKHKILLKVAGEKLLCQTRGIIWIHCRINNRTNAKTNN